MYEYTRVHGADAQSFDQLPPKPKISCAPHPSSMGVNPAAKTLSLDGWDVASIECCIELRFYKSYEGQKEHTSREGDFVAEKVGRMNEHIPHTSIPLRELLH